MIIQKVSGLNGLVDFPYEFKTKEEIKNLPEEDKTNKKVIDVNILDKISSQEELNGLLIKSLDGLDNILKNQDFTLSKGTEEIKRTWQRRSNSFWAFCQDCIEEDEGGSLTKVKLRREYGNYCKKYNRLTKQGDKSIKWTLETEYYAEESRDFERNTIWKGIKIKEDNSFTKVTKGISTPKSILNSHTNQNTHGKYGKLDSYKGNDSSKPDICFKCGQPGHLEMIDTQLLHPKCYDLLQDEYSILDNKQNGNKKR